MARVSPVLSSALPPNIAEIYERYASDYGPFRNQVQVLAHVPAAVAHLPAMLMELKQADATPQRYIELAIVAVSQINACDYCVAHHAPILRVAGVSGEGVARILDYHDHPELDEVDRLVVAFAIQVTEAPQHIRDELFEQLRRHFSESQIVELTLRIALCGFFNRFNDALMIETESETDAKAASAV